MINVTRRDPNVVRATVAERKLTWLGRAADGYDYATLRGQEYAVEPHPSNPEDHSRRRDELYVMRVKRELIDGSEFEHHGTHRALPVPAGTYTALVAKEAERQAALTRQPPSRPLDALSLHPLLRSRKPTIIPGRSPANPLLKGDGMLLEGWGPLRGVGAMLDALRSKGVTLALTDAGTMYALGPRLTVDVLSLIEDASPLLHAHLHGQPVRCELRHKDQAPEAVTLLVGGAAACEQHVTGELEP